MKIQFYPRSPGGAAGEYAIEANGFATASLYWANESGILPDWSAIAHLSLSETGESRFIFEGKRAIPPEATHVLARCVSADGLLTEECAAEIPQIVRSAPMSEGYRFAILTDLHLTNKPHKVWTALQQCIGVDAVLISGDLVNDGTPEQFAKMKKLLESLPMPVYAVTGNHDVPIKPIPQIMDDVCDWYSMQNWLCDRDQAHRWELDGSGAYAVRFGEGEIIGLNAVTHWRRFAFPDGAQMDWLEQHLHSTSDLQWHIVLCHAPLASHYPHHKNGEPAYLSRDERLQRIIDNVENVIYISGHTHMSVNHMKSSIEVDTEHHHLYINVPSIRPNTLKYGNELQEPDWASGMMMSLTISSQEIEIITKRSAGSMKYPRGYYRFSATGGITI